MSIHRCWWSLYSDESINSSIHSELTKTSVTYTVQKDVQATQNADNQNGSADTITASSEKENRNDNNLNCKKKADASKPIASSNAASGVEDIQDVVVDTSKMKERCTTPNSVVCSRKNCQDRASSPIMTTTAHSLQVEHQGTCNRVYCQSLSNIAKKAK